MDSMMELIVQPLGRSVPVAAGDNLLAVLRDNNIPVNSLAQQTSVRR